MKKQIIQVLLIVLLTSGLGTASSWAGQVVTNDIKAWAKEAIEQEKALSSQPAPHNSVAVLYFNNKSNKTNLDLLEKGLTLMLITDLNKVKEIQLVERVKLQALINEMGLSKAKLTDKQFSAKMGKLLGAANLVGGDILGGQQKNFQVASNLLSVKDEKIFGKPEVEGKLLDELFKMEKALVFDIIRMLKIELSPEEIFELKQPFTNSIRALVYYIKAVDYSDAQEYAIAREYYEKALAEDPGFDMAELGLMELKDLNLYEIRAEAYEEPEDKEEELPLEPKGPRKTEKVRDRSEVENNLSTGAIELDFDIDFDLYDHLRNNLTADMVVDLDGISSEIQKTAASDIEMKAIADGKYVGGSFTASGQWTSSGYTFWSGDYSEGFQTVGQNNGSAVYFQPGTYEYYGLSLPSDSRTSFAEPSKGLYDGFLSYAIQLEEDRMNKKILEMAKNSETKYEVIDAINTALTKGNLRDRDGWFIRNADAQAGRVLRDSNGDMTRVQQYVLRPTPDSVQMVNACLRKGSSANAGFSSIVWTTKLNTEYYGSLLDIPWRSWLNSRPLDGSYNYGSAIYTTLEDYPGCLPTMMSIEFKNPSNDTLKESRYFTIPADTANGYDQRITDEILDITNGESGKSMRLFKEKDFVVMRDNIGQSENVFQGYFINASETPINVSFSILSDTDGEKIPETPLFTDIWDALRVNESGAKNIGNNCLGININTDSELLSAPIDVIYIPMSRMLWKDDEDDDLNP